MTQGCYIVIFSGDNCFVTNKYTGSKIICQAFRETFLDKSKRPRFLGRFGYLYPPPFRLGKQQSVLNNNRCRLVATAPSSWHKCYSPALSRKARDLCLRTGVRSTNVGTMRTSRTNRWQFRFNALLQYTNRTGTSLVPATQVELYEGTNVAIGSWVANNRQQYRTGALPIERQQLLETLTNWTWSKQKPGRRYDTDRDVQIENLHKRGVRVGIIAVEFNLSRQRVHQIIKRKSLPNVQ